MMAWSYCRVHSPKTIVYGAAAADPDPGHRKREPQGGFGRRYRSEPDQGRLTGRQTLRRHVKYAGRMSELGEAGHFLSTKSPL